MKTLLSRMQAGRLLAGAAAALGPLLAPVTVPAAVGGVAGITEDDDASIAAVRSSLRNADPRVAVERWMTVMDKLTGAVVRDPAGAVDGVRAVEDEIRKLGPDGLAFFRRLVDGETAQQLERARREWRADLLRRLVRKRFLSRYGDDAGWTLAGMLIDRGAFQEAYRVLRRVIEEHPDPDVDRGGCMLRLALCAVRVGDLESARRWLGELRETDAVRGRSAAARGVEERVQAVEDAWKGSVPCVPSWRVAHGNARQWSVLDSAPSMSRAALAWSVALGDMYMDPVYPGPGEVDASALRRQMGDGAGWLGGGVRGFRLGSSSARVRWDRGRYVARTAGGVVCMDPAGREVWRQDVEAARGPMIVRRAVRTFDVLGRSLSMDGDAVYAIGDVMADEANWMGGIEVLFCLDRESGSVRWSCGPKAPWDEALHMSWITGALRVGDRVIGAVKNERHEVYLLALGARGGDLSWRTWLGFSLSGEASLRSWDGDRLIPGALCSDGDTVYLGLGRGTVHAVDVRTGRVRWIRAYGRGKTISRADLPLWMLRANALAVTGADRLLALPPDVDEALVFDTGTGEIVSSFPCGDVFRQFAGPVPGGFLVMTGEGLTAYTLPEGRVAWTFSERLSGLPAMTRDAVLAPLGDRVAELDPATGNERRRWTARRAGGGPLGNLATDGTRVLTVDNVGLDAIGDAGQLLAEASTDLVARARALCALKRFEEARAELDRALREETGAGADDDRGAALRAAWLDVAINELEQAPAAAAGVLEAETRRVGLSPAQQQEWTAAVVEKYLRDRDWAACIETMYRGRLENGITPLGRRCGPPSLGRGLRGYLDEAHRRAADAGGEAFEAALASWAQAGWRQRQADTNAVGLVAFASTCRGTEASLRAFVRAVKLWDAGAGGVLADLLLARMEASDRPAERATALGYSAERVRAGLAAGDDPEALWRRVGESAEGTMMLDADGDVVQARKAAADALAKLPAAASRQPPPGAPGPPYALAWSLDRAVRVHAPWSGDLGPGALAFSDEEAGEWMGVDVADGRVRWCRKIPGDGKVRGWLLRVPGQGHAAILNEGDTYTVVDLRTGTGMAGIHAASVSRSLSTPDGLLVLYTQERCLEVYDQLDGALVWRRQLETWPFTVNMGIYGGHYASTYPGESGLAGYAMYDVRDGRRTALESSVAGWSQTDTYVLPATEGIYLRNAEQLVLVDYEGRVQSESATNTAQGNLQLSPDYACVLGDTTRVFGRGDLARVRYAGPLKYEGRPVSLAQSDDGGRLLVTLRDRQQTHFVMITLNPWSAKTMTFEGQLRSFAPGVFGRWYPMVLSHYDARARRTRSAFHTLDLQSMREAPNNIGELVRWKGSSREHVRLLYAGDRLIVCTQEGVFALETAGN